jgi:hypothetical protein
MTAIRIAGCVTAVLALGLGGCGLFGQSGAYELVASAHPPITDIPVPVGFEIDDGHSRNFPAGSARFIDHVYNGDAEKWALNDFYKKMLPLKGWTQPTQMFRQGEIIMDCQKDGENCHLVIRGGSLFSSSQVKVQVWPSGRTSPPAKAHTEGLAATAAPPAVVPRTTQAARPMAEITTQRKGVSGR